MASRFYFPATRILFNRRYVIDFEEQAFWIEEEHHDGWFEDSFWKERPHSKLSYFYDCKKWKMHVGSVPGYTYPVEWQDFHEQDKVNQFRRMDSLGFRLHRSDNVSNGL